MECRSCLDSIALGLLIDTSALINVSATGYANEIVEAIPNKCFLVREVEQELARGTDVGYPDGRVIQALVDQNQLEVCDLAQNCLSEFMSLVSGHSIATLDDGEAATVACAVGNGYCAVIDDRKATRICGERYSSLIVASTLDLLAHVEVVRSLGRHRLADAVFNALTKARMNVPDHYHDWVLNLLGTDRASLCNSLPNRLRQR